MSVHSFSAARHHATLQKGQVCDRSSNISSSRLWSTTELSASWLAPALAFPETLLEVSPLGKPLETLLGQIGHGRILVPR